MLWPLLPIRRIDHPTLNSGVRKPVSRPPSSPPLALRLLLFKVCQGPSPRSEALLPNVDGLKRDEGVHCKPIVHVHKRKHPKNYCTRRYLFLLYRKSYNDQTQSNPNDPYTPLANVSP